LIFNNLTLRSREGGFSGLQAADLRADGVPWLQEKQVGQTR